MKQIFIFLVLLMAIVALNANSQNQEIEVGVEEKLGQFVPMDLPFLDEKGDTVKLGEMINGKPTVLSLVYFNCPGICSPLLDGVVDVVDRVSLEPGKDFQLVTISFDPKDSPALALQKKKNYLKGFHRDFSDSLAWRWLTGDSASIAAITQAVGFRYKRSGKDFIHPGVLTILSPEGKIARYLNGISYSAFNLKMALIEASKGKTGPTINKVLAFCFSYDPEGKTYAFNILRVMGTVTILFIAVFVVFLVFGTKKRKKEN